MARKKEEQGKKANKRPTATEVTTKKAKEIFLKRLADLGSPTLAANGMKTDRVTFYRWRRVDSEFADAWDELAISGNAALEDEARKRAFEGSDTLLIFLLKGAYPHKYKDRQDLKLSGSVNIPAVSVNVLPPSHSYEIEDDSEDA